MKETVLQALSRVERAFLTLYGRALWRSLVRRAERLRARSRTRSTVAVIRHPFNPKGLMYIDRAGFREFRRRRRLKGRVTFGSLLAGAWYRTADAGGDNALSERELAVRREAFVRSVSALWRGRREGGGKTRPPDENKYKKPDKMKK